MHDEISEQQVEHYLSQHPDFFIHHEALLLSLQLPHEGRGGAVSLVERQMGVMRATMERDRMQLQGLQQSADMNERLLAQLQRLILSLIESDSLDDAIEYLYSALENDFHADQVAIRLFISGSDRAEAVDIDDPKFAPLRPILQRGQSLCGPIRSDQLIALFGEGAELVHSAVVLPLCRGEGSPCLGILALGSEDPGRYSSEMGTLFIDHLGSVINHIFLSHLRK